MSHPTSTSLHQQFFSPLTVALEGASSTRNCPSFPDDQWLEACVTRVLEQEPSGHGLLQYLFDTKDINISRSTYFDANASNRRLFMLNETGESVGDSLDRSFHRSGNDPLADIPELANYDVFAGDGHYLKAATHDAPIGGKRRPVGHFFGLDLRTHRMFSMAVAETGNGRKREHDMRALKNAHIDTLRRGTPKGRQVIWAWDKAGIDAPQWIKWKQQSGVYFISRAKENMTLETSGILEFDASDPINNGVLEFKLVSVASNALRYVRYCDPASGNEYEFISSLTDVRPGVIAAIYMARWDIEKVFDETKTKLGEKKSWGSTDTARKVQAESIALVHNLLIILELFTKEHHSLEVMDDANRRQVRLDKAKKAAAERGEKLSPLVCSLWLRATQRGLRFIRWLRNGLTRGGSLDEAMGRLRVIWGYM